jgi:hypothetical protein
LPVRNSYGVTSFFTASIWGFRTIYWIKKKTLGMELVSDPKKAMDIVKEFNEKI